MVLSGIRSTLLERRLACQIDVNVMHSAELPEQRARFVDDHRVDMEPLSIAGGNDARVRDAVITEDALGRFVADRLTERGRFSGRERRSYS